MLLASLDLHWHAKVSSLLLSCVISICSIMLNTRSDRSCKFTHMWFKVRRWQTDERPRGGAQQMKPPVPKSSKFRMNNHCNQLCEWAHVLMEPYWLNQISWVEMWTTDRDKDAENPLMRWINWFNSASAFRRPRLNLPVRVSPIYLW